MWNFTHSGEISYVRCINYQIAKYNSFYIYEHSQHVMCSQVIFSQIGLIVTIQEQEKYVSHRCREHTNHFSLLPYFMGDSQLNRVYGDLVQQGDDKGAAFLDWYVKKARLDKHYYVDENQWTEQLSKCLELQDLR